MKYISPEVELIEFETEDIMDQSLFSARSIFSSGYEDLDNLDEVITL